MANNKEIFGKPPFDGPDPRIEMAARCEAWLSEWRGLAADRSDESRKRRIEIAFDFIRLMDYMEAIRPGDLVSPEQWTVAYGIHALGGLADALLDATKNLPWEDGPPRPVTWHEVGEAPPPQFAYGPLEGSQDELAHAIIRENADRRTLVAQLEKGVFWGRENARDHFSIWFKTEARYREAAAKVAKPSIE